ncbi:MAG: diguanylate cyclase [Solidesulfovibrio sp. DCME]|uniref:sensor domain-containing diguanylate cyclase n=1 Tax=Solidesulfovibrio sp. DCME TaxID=3447380 RepID=UPI003D12C7E9
MAKSILAGLPMPFLLVDAQERVVKTNQACLDMLEIRSPVASCCGKTLAEVFYNDPSRKTYVGQSIRTGEVFRDIEVPIVNHGAEERHVLANVFPLFDADGRCIGGMCIYVDSTKDKQAKRRLRELATRDSLTGLCNRQHALELAGALFESARRRGADFSVVIFDLDHFKAVNDTRGHDAGDAVLRNIGEAAQAHFRCEDVLGRIGGEEFLVAMPDTAGREAVDAMERFRHAVASVPVPYEDAPVRVTISSGVAPLTRHDKTFEALLRKADTALYLAKRGGRNAVVACPG